ncbi:pkd2 [Symbiodinium pilosum]|uniref:Pkd2 protein n=1 Tax=Symbiodinium pilosum TaxID=2952 RepID=A0A812UMP9_SYMPI|nr:pkd2 [Symbiodinium pilosum]
MLSRSHCLCRCSRCASGRLLKLCRFNIRCNMPRRRRIGGLSVALCLAATGCFACQLAFSRPWMARKSQVARPAQRTPGNQPTKEPEFPEFAPSGEYAMETPLFKLEKYKKEESMGLATVAGVFVVLSIIIGFVATSYRPQVNLLEEQPKQEEPKPSAGLNREGKPIRKIMLGGGEPTPY